MTAVLSNQKIIDEIRDIQDSYIKTRPKMEMSVFKPTRFGEYNLGDERGGRHHLNMAMRQGLSMIHPLAPAAANLFINKSHGGMMGSGSPAFQKHPLSYGNINGNTLHPDPLYSGVVYQKYKNTKGGALLEKSMPLTGESESDTDSGSESDEGGDIMSESSEGEFSSDEEGELGGRRKPAGKISNLVKTRPAKFESNLCAPAKGGSKIGDIAKQAGQAIYKVINTAEAKGLAEGAIKTAIMGVLTAYFGAAGTAVGAVGISEVDKLRRQFGNKDKGSGVVSSIKETAASIKKRLKPVGDAIYKAVNSPQAKALGAVAVIGLISAIIAQKMGISRESVERMIRGSLERRAENYSELGVNRNRSPSPSRSISNPIHSPYVTNQRYRDPNESLYVPPVSPLEQIIPVKVPKLLGRHSPQEELSPAEMEPFHTLDDAIQNIERGSVPDLNTPEGIYAAVNRATNDNPYIQELLRGPGLKKKRGGKIVPPSVKKIVKTKRGENVRGAIVAEVMRKQGLSLAQASKYVKEKGLY